MALDITNNSRGYLLGRQVAIIRRVCARSMQRSGNVYTLFPALCDPKDGKPSCYAYWRGKALRRGDNALSEVTERLGSLSIRDVNNIRDRSAYWVGYYHQLDYDINNNQ